MLPPSYADVSEFSRIFQIAQEILEESGISSALSKGAISFTTTGKMNSANSFLSEVLSSRLPVTPATNLTVEIQPITAIIITNTANPKKKRLFLGFSGDSASTSELPISAISLSISGS